MAAILGGSGSGLADAGAGENQSPRLGVLAFVIADAEGGPMPGRLTFTRESDPDAAFDITLADESHKASSAVRQNVVYTATGRGRVLVSPGRYRVTASRGIEWSLESASILLSAEIERSFQPRLRRELDTTGFIGADLHIHTATHSEHGDANVAEQLMALAGEGVEFAVATEHNAIADYGRVLRRLGLSKHLMTISGNEVSTQSGHWNAFPLDPKRPAVASHEDTVALFAMLRRERDGVLLQVNHPRSTLFPYFTLQGLDPVTGDATGPHYSPDYDLIEILNGSAGWGYFQSDGPLASSNDQASDAPGESSDESGSAMDPEQRAQRDSPERSRRPGPKGNRGSRKGRPQPEPPEPNDASIEESAGEAAEQVEDADAESEVRRSIGSSRHSVLRDWFHLLDRGHRYTAVGNSDSHSLGVAEVAGWPRNFVQSRTDSPSKVEPSAIAAALREGRSLVTTGPFVSVRIGTASPGDVVAAETGEVELHVRVQAASWISLDRVKIIVNGQLAREIPIDAPDPLPVVRLDTLVPLSLTGDSWVVVLAEGDTPLSPIVVPSERAALPIAIANPIRVKVGPGAATRESWTSPWSQAQALAATGTAAEIEAAIAGDEPAAARARVLLAAVSAGVESANALVTIGLGDSREDARDVRLAAARAAEQLRSSDLLEALDAAWSDAATDPYLRAALLRAYAASDSSAFLARLLEGIEARDSVVLSRHGQELAALRPSGFVRDWSVLGNFPVPAGKQSMQHDYGPELDPDLSRSYRGRGGGEIGWRNARADALGFLDLARPDLPPSASQHAIAYAQVYLYSPEWRAVSFALGADDGCRVYLNGSLIYDDPSRHAANPWQHFGRLRLRRGWNRVLFKVENGVSDFGLYLQLFDDDIRTARAPE